MHIDSTAAELVVLSQMVRRLAELRHHLDYDEILRISNLMRDCADDLDRGAGDRLPPTPRDDAVRVDGDMPDGVFLADDPDRGGADLPSPRAGVAGSGGWTPLGDAVSRIMPVSVSMVRQPRPGPPIRPATRRPS